MKFSQKNIENWRFWKTSFFWVGHFEFFFSKIFFFATSQWKSVNIYRIFWRIFRNFDDYPGFQPMRSWANTCAQVCTYFSKQEEDSADVSDFVSNLRSALRNEISALIDMEEAQQGYPAYSITHKRRFVPQQLMGWKSRGNTAIDSSHGLKRKQQIKKFF